MKKKRPLKRMLFRAKRTVRYYKWECLIMAIFFVPMLIFGLTSVFDADLEFSQQENRALKKKPEFSFETLFAGKYTRAVDEYYADTFPLRDWFMSVSTGMNKFYYWNSGDGALVISHDGGGAAGGGEALDDILRAQGALPLPQDTRGANPEVSPEASGSPEPAPEPVPELANPREDEAFDAGSSVIIIGNRAMEIPYTVAEANTEYAAFLNELKAMLPEKRVISLLTPNGGEFYSPESFHSGQRSQKAMIDSVYSQLDGVIPVDAYGKLRSHVDKYIYFRTDHHWTALGAYYAYTAFCEAAGFDPVPLDSFRTGRYEGFVGSMFRFTSKYPQSKVLTDNPDFVDYYEPVVESTAEYYSSGAMMDPRKIPVVNTNLGDNVGNKYLCFISGDTPVCRITTENKNGKRAIIVKESYGNAFTPFLTSHYEEIFVIDFRQFNTKDKPDLNLPEFAGANEVNDVIVLDYPFVPNGKAFIKMLNAMLK